MKDFINDQIPRMENPIPPPPLTEEGKAWMKYHISEMARVERQCQAAISTLEKRIEILLWAELVLGVSIIFFL